MKIKMVAHTIDEEGSHVPGELLEIRDELAEEWIKKGWCIPVPAPTAVSKPIETAVVSPPEDGLSERGKKSKK